MREEKPANPFQRRVFELRVQAQDALLGGASGDQSADIVGMKYAAYIGRYKVLRDLEVHFAELIAKGDTSE